LDRRDLALSRVGCLSRRTIWSAGLALGLVVVAWGLVQAGDSEQVTTKRRQQGILTGMPFMANLAPRTFVDDLGRKIFLAKAPTRIISIAPSITEILYAVGAGDQVVGVTTYCDYPPEARSKPKIGYLQPNLESIIALRPDLVLAPREFLRADIVAKLEQLKIATFILDAKTIEDIPSHIRTVGRMLERSAAADQLATDMRRRIAEVRTRTERLPHPRVLYVLNSTPLITVGPGSFIHRLIELAGGTNVAAHAASPYPRLTMEAVLKEDPELIVFPVGAAEGIPEAEQQQWRRWTTLSAVKHGRFHQVHADLLNRPGPRIVEGLSALARIVHPEVFGADRAPDP
jgi:iron complex transport system substrate-binding protein